MDWEADHIGPQYKVIALILVGMYGHEGDVRECRGIRGLGRGVGGERGALGWQMDWEADHIWPQYRDTALHWQGCRGMRGHHGVDGCEGLAGGARVSGPVKVTGGLGGWPHRAPVQGHSTHTGRDAWA